jgi:phosphoribosylformylglycinamidine cyclo-ligase
MGEVDVMAMANITGGGLRNLARWRAGMGYVIDHPMPVPPIFGALQEWGGIDDREMHQTFNMGLGYAVAVREADADRALEVLGRHHDCQVVGRVEEGSGVVHEPLGISFGEY